MPKSFNEKPNYLHLSQCKGHSEATTEQPLYRETEPELSHTDRRGGHCQASVTEVILGVELLLTQAYQTFSWMGCHSAPWLIVEKGRGTLRKAERKRDGARGAVRGAESP